MTLNHRVLIIEDDRWLAEQFQRLLLKSGFNAQIATNGLEAIQVIDEVKPDVIVLDVLLTGSTAFTLLHELQSYEDTAKIPVILCTNLATDFKLSELKPYGVEKLLDKSSMQPADIVSAVESLL